MCNDETTFTELMLKWYVCYPVLMAFIYDKEIIYCEKPELVKINRNLSNKYAIVKGL